MTHAATPGLHHVTMFASDPGRTHAFYAGTLGLRLVKRTVNFDDPGTYHLYYADGVGSPGSILTFFPVPGMRAGRQGAGQVGAVALAVPQAAMGFWADRLRGHGAEPAPPRFGAPVLAFRDPDGLALELVGMPDAGTAAGWDGAPVGAAEAIRTVHSVTLHLRQDVATAGLLTATMGFRAAGREDGRTRFEAGAGGAGATVDLLAAPGAASGTGGAGTVHHVAFRAADDAAQEAARAAYIRAGVEPTPVVDRQYFRSIYFREPGGVLFEVATDPPGFASDEAPDALGTTLKLPAWLESERAAVERALPPLELA